MPRMNDNLVRENVNMRHPKSTMVSPARKNLQQLTVFPKENIIPPIRKNVINKSLITPMKKETMRKLIIIDENLMIDNRPSD